MSYKQYLSMLIIGLHFSHSMEVARPIQSVESQTLYQPSDKNPFSSIFRDVLTKIFNYMVLLDADRYLENKKNTENNEWLPCGRASSLNDEIALKLHENYFSFSQTFYHFSKAFPSIIIGNKFDNFFVSGLRSTFFIRANIHLTCEFFNNFCSSLANHEDFYFERVYSIFDHFASDSDRDVKFTLKALNFLYKVPFSFSFLASRLKNFDPRIYYINLNRHSTEEYQERCFLLIESLCNPYIDSESKNRGLEGLFKKYESWGSPELTDKAGIQALKITLENHRNNKCKEKTNEHTGLHHTIHYLLTQKAREYGIKTIWIKNNNHAVLYYYLHNAHAIEKMRGSTQAFLAQEALLLILTKHGFNETLLLRLSRFLEHRIFNLGDFDECFMAHLLDKIVRKNSIKKLLIILPHFEEYSNQIKTYIKTTRKRQLFYYKFFNQFVDNVMLFATQYNKKFNEFMKFLKNNTKASDDQKRRKRTLSLQPQVNDVERFAPVHLQENVEQLTLCNEKLEQLQNELDEKDRLVTNLKNDQIQQKTDLQTLFSETITTNRTNYQKNLEKKAQEISEIRHTNYQNNLNENKKISDLRKKISLLKKIIFSTTALAFFCFAYYIAHLYARPIY